METTIRKMAGTLAAGLLLAVPALAQSGGSGIGVTVNRQPVSFTGQGPVSRGGRVLVPLRGVLEKLGAYVSYDSARREVRAVRNEAQIILPIGSRTAQVSGRAVALDTPAQILNGSTLVPLRFVAEALGAQVNYESATSTVAILSDTDNNGGPVTPRPAPVTNPGRAVRATVISVRPRQLRLVIQDANGDRRPVRLASDYIVRRRMVDGRYQALTLSRLLPGDVISLEMRNGEARTVTVLPARASDRL